MPQLGESVAEGTIGKWLKQPGDTVAKYEPLLEVITDKVNAEVPSPFAGVLKEILVEEGATVPNNAEIAVIETADEAGGNGTAPVAAAPAEAATPQAAAPAEPEAPASGPAGSDESGPGEQKPAVAERAAASAPAEAASASSAPAEAAPASSAPPAAPPAPDRAAASAAPAAPSVT